MARKPKPVREQCTATAHGTGVRCRATADPGATVCRVHGGSAPQVKAAAQRRVQTEDARKAVATFGLPVDTEPMQALVDELRRTAGHVAWLGALIAGLSHGEVAGDGPVGQMVPHSGSGLVQILPGSAGGVTVAPSVWVDLYQAERRHLVTVAATLVKLGFTEREVRVLEFQASAFVGALRSIFADLGMLDDPRVPDVVERRLRELSVDASSRERTR